MNKRTVDRVFAKTAKAKASSAIVDKSILNKSSISLSSEPYSNKLLQFIKSVSKEEFRFKSLISVDCGDIVEYSNLSETIYYYVNGGKVFSCRFVKLGKSEISRLKMLGSVAGYRVSEISNGVVIEL